MKEGIRRIKLAFPDWRENIDEMITEGNRVVTRYTSHGTHRGDFRGIAPTGRTISDELDRLRQLGAAPTGLPSPRG